MYLSTIDNPVIKGLCPVQLFVNWLMPKLKRGFKMGYTYEVLEYAKSDGGYFFEQRYAGESLIKAVIKTIKLKRDGAGCVRINYR